MLALWQELPLSIQPVIGYVGGFPLTWYALSYALGASLAAAYFVYLARKIELVPNTALGIELIVSVLWGVLIGARLGYVLFYGGELFLQEPWRIISPYDFSTGEWVGIRGMSFHGGLIGGTIGLFMFTREAGRDFLRFSDTLVRAVPIAIFFGRLGNFLNQEIMGRVTSSPWGMYFPTSGTARLHPVTLYEALLEGMLLFILLAIFSRKLTHPGQLTAAFLVLYAFIRYLAENYRAVSGPETLVAGILSMGQALSIAMIFVALLVLLLTRKRMV